MNHLMLSYNSYYDLIHSIDLEDTDEEDLNESSFAPDDSFIDDLKRKSSKYIDDEEEEEEEYDEDMVSYFKPYI